MKALLAALLFATPALADLTLPPSGDNQPAVPVARRRQREHRLHGVTRSEDRRQAAPGRPVWIAYDPGQR